MTVRQLGLQTWPCKWTQLEDLESLNIVEIERVWEVLFFWKSSQERNCIIHVYWKYNWCAIERQDRKSAEIRLEFK